MRGRADDLLSSRCTLVVAAAGYGKTTAVRSSLPPGSAVWLSGVAGDRVVEHLVEAGATAGCAHRPRYLVVDDLAEVPADTLPAVLGAVGQLPSATRVVLIARSLPQPPLPRCGRGQLREVVAADLAMSADAVADLLRRDYRIADAALAAGIHALTAGWPALVHLVARAVDPGTAVAALLDVVVAPGATVAGFLVEEVLDQLPPAIRRLVRDMAYLADIGASRAPTGRVQAGLARAVGHRCAEHALATLTRSGLFTVDSSAYAMVPLLAAVVCRCEPVPHARRGQLRSAAAGWLAEHGHLAAAVRCHLAGQDLSRVRQLLTDHGARLLADGAAETVAEAVAALPEPDRSPQLRLLRGEALHVSGASDAALAELTALGEVTELEAGARGPAEAAAPDGTAGPIGAGLAWRLGLIHYLRGEPRTALEVFARGRTDSPCVDVALLLAWTAAAYWMAGDAAACRGYADRARAAATALGAPQALAAAHVALALHAMLVGDRAGNEEHSTYALRFAEAAGDRLQLTRILANRAARHLEEGRFADALAASAPAVALAEATRYAPMLALAQCNRGAALVRLGRLDEALHSYEQARSLFQRMGARTVAYPLIGLAEVHRLRGRANLARACYEEAVRVSQQQGYWQGLVPALAGLSRLVAPEEPETAYQLAGRALATEAGPSVVGARLALGHAALAAGRLDAAVAAADAAATAARLYRDPAGLAEALELGASAATDQARARAALREAQGVWRDSQASLDIDRVTVLLGRLPGTTAQERVDARLAAQRLAAIEVVVPLGAANGPAGHEITVRMLGRFEVYVRGQPVPPTACPSRKARDLLRILLARQGRAVPRDELAELLWPGEPAHRVTHRLSVALSTLRSVLDPGRGTDPSWGTDPSRGGAEPSRRTPVESAIVADQASVALRMSRLTVDLVTFLADAEHGLRLLDRGEAGQAAAVLGAAEQAYAGDVFADEPYDDWSVPVREQARAVYLRVVRTLADLARDAGDSWAAVRYLHQILASDPYDEPAHRSLVQTLAAAGSHGEARRAYGRYAEAMRALDLPAPRRPADVVSPVPQCSSTTGQWPSG